MQRDSTTPCRAGRISALAGAIALGTWITPALAAPPASDTVLVQVSGAMGTADRARVARELDGGAVNAIPGGWREYRLDHALTLREARSELRDVAGVRRVVLPAPLTTDAVPNDPLFGPTTGGYQWGLRNTASWQGGQAGADIAAADGWARQANGEPVVVAVIDTGVDTTHPDLASRVWSNDDEIAGNGVDDDGNGYVDDVNGWDFAADDASVFDGAGDDHGTHVAGIIAAERDNGIGIAGVSSNVRIMPLKFISGGQGWNTDAIRAMQYAVANGAKVVNASFGGKTYDPALCSTISWAADRGVTVVVAAGNAGSDLGTADAWPAKCPEATQMTVGAFTHAGTLAAFSNHGPDHVDLAAPGEWIVSTLPGGDYGYMSGTSMATPFVTGAAAAVLGETPDIAPSEVRARILGGATASPALSTTIAGGRRLSLAGALASTPQTAVAPDTAPPAAFGLIAPANGAIVRSVRPAFSWSPSSDESGITEYRLRIDGQIRATVAGTRAVPATALPQGVSTWSVEAVDGAGNIRASEFRQVTVDTTAPTAPRVLTPSAEDRPVTDRLTVVRWSPSTDTGTAVAQYRVLINGRTVASTPASVLATRVRFRSGRQVLQVLAVDGAGNATTSPRTVVRTLTLAARRRIVRIKRARRVALRARIRVQRARVASARRPRVRVRSRAALAVNIDLVQRGKTVARTRTRLRRGTTTVALRTRSLARGDYRTVVRIQGVSAASGLLSVR